LICSSTSSSRAVDITRRRRRRRKARRPCRRRPPARSPIIPSYRLIECSFDSGATSTSNATLCSYSARRSRPFSLSADCATPRTPVSSTCRRLNTCCSTCGAGRRAGVQYVLRHRSVRWPPRATVQPTPGARSRHGRAQICATSTRRRAAARHRFLEEHLTNTCCRCLPDQTPTAPDDVDSTITRIFTRYSSRDEQALVGRAARRLRSLLPRRCSKIAHSTCGRCGLVPDSSSAEPAARQLLGVSGHLGLHHEALRVPALGGERARARPGRVDQRLIRCSVNQSIRQARPAEQRQADERRRAAGATRREVAEEAHLIQGSSPAYSPTPRRRSRPSPITAPMTSSCERSRALRR